jgi:hypothetical protein
MKSIPKVASGSLIALLLAVAPASALASKTATVARTRDVVYRDRTPRVHDGTPRQHHHHQHTNKVQ